MKVLFDTYKFAMQNPGGGEMIIHQLREKLLNRGIHVDLFDKWTHKVSDYDIVHYFSISDWYAFDTFKLYGPKMVLTPTCWPDYSLTKKMRSSVGEWIKNLTKKGSCSVTPAQALQNFDLILPTTQMEADLISQNLYAGAKMKVLYNGVRPLDQIEVGAKIGGDFYLFIGSIRPNKNLDVIMRAVAKRGEKLVIMGVAPAEFSEYEKLCRSIPGDFEFLGHVDNSSDQYFRYLKSAKALINASDFETFSLVGIEAGLMKTPVVMTERGATKEVYGDRVLYVTPKSVDSISKALNLLNEIDLDAHFNYCKKNYSIDAIVDQLIGYYREIL